jgi:hypothetical protein
MGRDILTDPRTILRTTSTPIRSRTFHHFGLKKGLLSELKKGLQSNDIHLIKMQINIDGTFVFKTNLVNLWVISCRVTYSVDTQPVIIFFAGKGKTSKVE